MHLPKEAHWRHEVTFLKLLKGVGLLIIALGTCLTAQDAPILDETIKPLSFESLGYPLVARLTHVQGVVVVRAKLDAEGNVVSSTAISGAKSLLPDCLSNAKKWRFQPNIEKTAVIVYHFQFEGLCNVCTSQFRFEPPNIATVTIGEQVVEPSGK
jgi:hypothetical protein